MAAMLVLLTPLCVVAQNNDTTATGDTSRAAFLTVVEVDEGGTRHAISSTSRRGIVDINSSMNDPATRHGDGYLTPEADNIIELTTRKQGYEIVQLDWFD